MMLRKVGVKDTHITVLYNYMYYPAGGVTFATKYKYRD